MKRAFYTLLSLTLLFSFGLTALAGCKKDKQKDPPAPATEASTEQPTDPQTDPQSDAPTEPETDAPTEPETDAPTEPETDPPTDPQTEPETDPAPTEPSVTFLSKDGRLIAHVPLSSGTPVVAPAAPEEDGYTFVGWNKDYKSARSPMTVTALYTEDVTPSTPAEILAWQPTYTSTRYGKSVGVYKDLVYGTRGDVTDEGEGFDMSKKTGGWLLDANHGGTGIHRHRTGQLFDVYLPADFGASTPILLYVHGGSWSQNYDKDGSAFELLARIAANGYIVVSMDYILQSNNTEDGVTVGREGATLAAMLGDIDLMVSYLRDVLMPTMGLPTDNKIAIAGTSAGAHLASLYAFDEHDTSKLGLSLTHKLEIGLLMSIVGPDDLAEILAMLAAANGISFSNTQALAAIPVSANPFTQLFARLLGDEGIETLADLIEPAAFWSPVRLVEAGIPDVILAYAETSDGSGTDGIIPTSTFYNLRTAVTEAGADCDAALFVGIEHGQIDDIRTTGEYPIKGTEITIHPAVWMAQQMAAHRDALLAP
ncbi:MAG: InlB B-repeat-containing protein [Clostridia bacterium]|nr:InlB B-repeat-containing protein [Clostridia bacterium]